ncbi:TraR/DksA C4-type zinc finger protein [Rouxiella silvae]|uniref:TraR/DksA C4-type zinc finger protein n=1 Tax=Rouxiella silvae TaxID=1646373 RepID=A0AA40X006_9GAMM|nr:TraR/DksA C4-type zinc finger protein [Rouxiella silvae]MBF6636213.1 TraR/DksA C4-type zinc finger protein [Rouxiella silvae]
MSDAMDLEQARQAEVLERQIKAATVKPDIPSAFFCEDCEVTIPERRRAALFGVTRCVDCQDIEDKKSKHRVGLHS